MDNMLLGVQICKDKRRRRHQHQGFTQLPLCKPIEQVGEAPEAFAIMREIDRVAPLMSK